MDAKLEFLLLFVVYWLGSPEFVACIPYCIIIQFSRALLGLCVPPSREEGGSEVQQESQNDSTTGHIHQDNPDAYICLNFLLGSCKKGRSCSEHHCPLPFHWQCKVVGLEEWKSFSKEDNHIQEKLFCDPREDINPDLTNNLQNGTERNRMNVFVWEKRFHRQLRRLSTESHVTNPSNSLATKWIWYWKDRSVWKECGNDVEGRDLQQLLEELFLNKQPQTSDSEFPNTEFTNAAPVYKLKYLSTHTQLGNSTCMELENQQDGTVRHVRRRPTINKVISEEDIQQLKRNLPSHWSPMADGLQCTRERLPPDSEEFIQVETLFNETMIDRALIDSIERVQNPYLWITYCRKRENMTAFNTRDGNNEKLLFHGTSPEAVVAICKRNFDWRLHGKNATKYGQGSYFAVNASYSHSYAKRDVDSCQYMFLANVLVGSYTQGHSGLPIPPAINPSNPESDLYDSCVDNIINPRMFIIFEKDQCYPAYVIKYEDKSDGYSTVPLYSLGATSSSGTLGHSGGSQQWLSSTTLL